MQIFLLLHKLEHVTTIGIYILNIVPIFHCFTVHFSIQ